MEELEPLRWRDWFRFLRPKPRWVIFAAGVAFFVTSMGYDEGWPAGQIVLVLTIAFTSALLAVSLDRVE